MHASPCGCAEATSVHVYLDHYSWAASLRTMPGVPAKTAFAVATIAGNLCQPPRKRSCYVFPGSAFVTFSHGSTRTGRALDILIRLGVAPPARLVAASAFHK